MLLFWDEKIYNVLKSADDLMTSIKDWLKEREEKPEEEKKNIYVKRIKELKDTIEQTIKSERKYYEFYKKHTYQYWEEVSITDSREYYIECKRCWYRERLT